MKKKSLTFYTKKNVGIKTKLAIFSSFHILIKYALDIYHATFEVVDLIQILGISLLN